MVFCGVCSHGPGITARTERAEPQKRERLLQSYARMRQALLDARPDVLVVIAAEHFANFFMNNMPAFAVGMADHYEGPIEDPEWLRIPHTRVPGNRDISLLEGLYEDMPIIELQQKILKQDPDFQLKSMPSDVGLNHMRWLVAQQLKKEQAAPQRTKEQRRKEMVATQ